MAEFLTACKFYFEADGLSDKLLIEISGLSCSNPVGGGENVQGSGKGGTKTRQATPTVEKFTHVNVKLVATSERDLYTWYENCNKTDAGSGAWRSNRKSASVTAYDQSGTMQARWEVQNCYPCKYTGPTFSAASPNMANESLELVHEGIKRVM
jgi:phage tail-like protein